MKTWRASDGFSLVEMMVVVAIIGLMAGVVVLSIPDAENKLETSLRRSEQAFTALARRSVMTGEVIGVRFLADGYQTLALTEEGWQPNTDLLKADVTRFRPLVLAEVSVDGETLALDSDDAARLQPHIWFLPTGEQIGFRLTLADGINQGTLVADAMGRIRVERDG